MTLLLSLPSEIEVKLRQRAAAEGAEPGEYAVRLLAEAVSRPSVEQLLAPFRKQVTESGMTDEQLDEFFRQQLQATRDEIKVSST